MLAKSFRQRSLPGNKEVDGRARGVIAFSNLPQTTKSISS